jgi:hypothetical protein
MAGRFILVWPPGQTVAAERPLALQIALPKYDFPVHHSVKVLGVVAPRVSLTSAAVAAMLTRIRGSADAQLYPPAIPRLPVSLVVVQDPESARESPIEAKHQKLARVHRSSPVDRDLRPTPAVRSQLNVRDLSIPGPRVPASVSAGVLTRCAVGPYAGHHGVAAHQAAQLG